MKKVLYSLALFGMILLAGGCEQELMDYEGEEGVYFAVQHGNRFGSERVWPYQPYTNVEFVKTLEDQITVNIKVMVTGPLKSYDRPFLVAINADSTTAVAGVHYEPLSGETVIIPANATTGYVPVIVKRTPDMSTEIKKIGLKLIPNEHFTLAFEEWDAIARYTEGSIVPSFDASLHTLNINDFIVKPAVWTGSADAEGTRESGYWGTFSRKKIELMCDYFDVTYDDFASVETMPMALQLFMANTLSQVLIDAYNRKEPILEEDGRLMWLRLCPWQSNVGVPWIPEF